MYVNLQENICWESFSDVKFDLGPLLQGQIREGQHKSAYISLIIGSRGFYGTVNLYETICYKSFGDVKFDLGLLLQGQTKAGKHKSAYISLIVSTEAVDTMDLA